MKKVLFASTALIATAGVAAAEVNFSGYGRLVLATLKIVPLSFRTSPLRVA